MNFRKWRTAILCAVTGLVSALLAAQAQVPGVNSTLQSVFTLAYDNSTMKATYSTSSSFVLASSPTDVCTITGSATKNIRVRRVIIGVLTPATATTEYVSLIKRSTTTTGGAGDQPTKVPYDSRNTAATAVVEHFTTNGTQGTVVGALIEYLFPVASAAANTTQLVELVYGHLGSPIVLVGAAQQLAVNLSGTSHPSSASRMTCTFEWTEE